MCRLFEAIISEKVLIHLLGNDQISPNQHGFVLGKSTHTQLISVLSKWYCSYDNNLDIDVVYADLAKAFNTVSHPKLISILKFYAIDDKLVNWIQEFLSNRSQSVCNCALIMCCLCLKQSLVVFLRAV